MHTKVHLIMNGKLKENVFDSSTLKPHPSFTNQISNPIPKDWPSAFQELYVLHFNTLYFLAAKILAALTFLGHPMMLLTLPKHDLQFPIGMDNILKEFFVSCFPDKPYIESMLKLPQEIIDLLYLVDAKKENKKS